MWYIPEITPTISVGKERCELMKAVLEAAEILRDSTNDLSQFLLKDCKQIDWIYNPLDYAWSPHKEWIERFSGNGARRCS